MSDFGTAPHCFGSLLCAASGESAGSFSAHRGRVTAVAQLPVGQGVGLALTAGQDCAARLWKLPPPEASGNAEDPDSRKKKGGPVKGPAPELLAVYKGHTDSVAALAVSPAGERFASGGWDSGIHIWRTGGASRRVMHRVRHTIAVELINPNGREIYPIFQTF